MSTPTLDDPDAIIDMMATVASLETGKARERLDHVVQLLRRVKALTEARSVVVATAEAVARAVAHERRELEVLLEALRERLHTLAVMHSGRTDEHRAWIHVEAIDMVLQILRDRSRETT